jgi:hypothetical protein
MGKIDVVKIKNREGGSFYEIRVPKYSYELNKDKPLPKHPTLPDVISGFVRDEDLPKEGNTFKMEYHRKNNLAAYGILTADTCIDTVEKDGWYYFVWKEKGYKYILSPMGWD